MISRSSFDRLARASILCAPSLPICASFHRVATSRRVPAAFFAHAPGGALVGVPELVGMRSVDGGARRPLAGAMKWRGWGSRAFSAEADGQSEEPEQNEPQREDMSGLGEGEGGGGFGSYRGPTQEEIEADMTPVVRHPILSTETKDLLWKLNKDDPVENSHEALGKKFGLSPKRVRAICRLKQMEVDEEENPENDAEEHAVMMAEGARIHKEYQDFFGSVKSGFSSTHYKPELDGFEGVEDAVQEKGRRRKPRPLFEVMDPRTARRVVAKMLVKFDPKNFKSPVKAEEKRLHEAAVGHTSVTPIAQAHGLAPTMSKRFKFVFADIGKGKSGPERLVIVRDPSGELRAADYEERLRVERYIAPPRLPRV